MLLRLRIFRGAGFFSCLRRYPLFDAGVLLVAVFLGFLGGVEVDAVVLAGELGAVGAVDDHGIAVADERRILARGRLAAGGIGRDGQRLAVGGDDDLALGIGAIDRRAQRLQPGQHVRAGMTVVVSPTLMTAIEGATASRKASEELVGLP